MLVSIQGLAGVAIASPMNPGILSIQGLAGVAIDRGDYLGWSQESWDTKHPRTGRCSYR